MKNLFYLAAIMLLLAGIVSCQSELYKPSDMEETDSVFVGEKIDSSILVPRQPCPCGEVELQEVIPGNSTFFRTEGYLFKDLHPDIELLRKLYALADRREYGGEFLHIIVYDSRTNLCGHFMYKDFDSRLARICNFPDFAKKWDIPENGCKVAFSGTVYKDCGPHLPQESFGLKDFYFLSNDMLTTLEKI